VELAVICAGMLGKRCSCGKWHDTEGTLSEPIRKCNVIAALVIGSAVAFGLAVAVYGIWLSAFAAFKAEAVTIIKNRQVDAGPLSGKKYAELFAIVNAVTPALSRHGLSSSWKITKDDKDWIEVTCTLKHTGGHTESVSMGGPPDAGGAKNAIQARASTVSYLERYTLKAITGLSEQADDDDGAMRRREAK
jgi:hypothetical protein